MIKCLTAESGIMKWPQTIWVCAATPEKRYSIVCIHFDSSFDAIEKHAGVELRHRELTVFHTIRFPTFIDRRNYHDSLAAWKLESIFTGESVFCLSVFHASGRNSINLSANDVRRIHLLVRNGNTREQKNWNEWQSGQNKIFKAATMAKAICLHARTLLIRERWYGGEKSVCLTTSLIAV